MRCADASAELLICPSALRYSRRLRRYSASPSLPCRMRHAAAEGLSAEFVRQ